MTRKLLYSGWFLLPLAVMIALYFFVFNDYTNKDTAVREKTAAASQASRNFFTVIVLPDTQLYTEKYSHLKIFETQTSWIARQKQARNIVYVSHVGDVVEHFDMPEQWAVADRAMKTLDGTVAYGISPGNHDISPEGEAKLYSRTFPSSRLKTLGIWGGSYPGEAGTGSVSDKNTYRLFSAKGNNFLALHLEFCPPDEVVDWAGDILERYSDRKALVTTHSFINADAEREAGSSCRAYHSAGDNGGKEIWNKLIIERKIDNIILFLSGHDIWTENGAARRNDTANGTVIHQLLSDYQHLGQGGDGYLRIMTFHPRKDKIKVETYSPYHNTYRTEPENQFELDIEI